MQGGIYSDQKCAVCGGTLKDDGRKALACPLHPQSQATLFKVKFRGIYRRFRSYENAQRWLTGLRFEQTDLGFPGAPAFVAEGENQTAFFLTQRLVQ